MFTQCTSFSWCSSKTSLFPPSSSFFTASSWACRWWFSFFAPAGSTSGGFSSTSRLACRCSTLSFLPTRSGTWTTSRGVRRVLSAGLAWPTPAVKRATMAMKMTTRIQTTRTRTMRTTRRQPLRGEAGQQAEAAEVKEVAAGPPAPGSGMRTRAARKRRAATRRRVRMTRPSTHDLWQIRTITIRRHRGVDSRPRDKDCPDVPMYQPTFCISIEISTSLSPSA
mmetsp:Transcript_11007/g.23883  ORF Transcript_11007/g.23883 Transcript_11007/m.23883 type:complete len:223 (+) Transcript_11007:1915-2583(+)